MRRTVVGILAGILLCGSAGSAHADGAANRAAKHLPRFAALRADEVNLRTGPGRRYPIDWVYMKRLLPIQIIGEFDAWRKIRDFEGTTGWVHRSMLTGRRTVLVRAGVHALRRDPGGGPVIAKVESQVIGRLLRCHRDWCRVEFDRIRGWLPRAALWGVYKDEE